MSEIANKRVFDGDNYQRIEKATSWLGEDRKWTDYKAMEKDITDFLTSLGPGRVISMLKWWGQGWTEIRYEIWYWDWDKAGSETIQI
jgi:hypothetical protein